MREYKTDRAGWGFLVVPVSFGDCIRGFTLGLWLGAWPVLGVRCRRNWPTYDRLYPGRGGEVGILLLGRFVGFWNDPGY